MVRFETDPVIINSIANAPGVGEFVRPDGLRVDLSPAIGAEGCLFLSNGEDGLAALEETAPGVWQGHLMLAETCRGKRGLDTVRAMIDRLSSHGAVNVIWGNIPTWNKPARWFARRLGMSPLPTSDDDFENLELRLV